MKQGFYPEKEEAFKFRGAWWTPIMMVSKERPALHRELYRVEGPKCLTEDCLVLLEFEDVGSLSAICPVCEREHKFSVRIENLKRKARARYQGRLDGKLKRISLDDPLKPLVAKDKDKNNWVVAKFGHTSDGRKIISILVGDRSEKKGDKLHAFADIENEHLRFDWKNKKPHEVITEIVGYFPNTVHKLKKRKNK